MASGHMPVIILMRRQYGGAARLSNEQAPVQGR
jgi:hypothetical protein